MTKTVWRTFLDRGNPPVNCWVLLAKDDEGNWYLAWDEMFAQRKIALAFARENNWYSTYKAVRGELRFKP